MTDEFELFKKNIRSITSQDFNKAFSLIGKIVNHTSDMKYCDVEVRMKGGVHTFANVPAHGCPVEGSSGVIHFHDGYLQQPFCDCEYRLNPPEDVYKESLIARCFNWVDNGDFYYGTTGFTGENGDGKIELVEDSFTWRGKSCVLPEEGSFIEFPVDLSECKTKYFKFQCFYRGNNHLKVECYNTDTDKIIQTLPETIGQDYMIWVSSSGRFNWTYNKEVYPFIVDVDKDILNTHIKIRLTNYANPDNDKNITVYSDGEIVEMPTPHGVSVDGLLVFSENGDKHYYNSKNDVLKYHNMTAN